MEPDTKQQVLLAFYAEYQKDKPVMKNVSAKTLGMGKEIFDIAVDKLQSEGLIKDASIITGGNSPYPRMVFVENVKMTPYGIDYVEKRLSVNPTSSGTEKVKTLVQKMAEWGLEQSKDFAAKVLAELATKTTP